MLSIATRVTQKQQQQKANHDGNRRLREFDLCTPETSLWIPGIIDKCCGPVSYLVKLTNGQCVRRHVDHVKARQSTSDIVDSEDDFCFLDNSFRVTPATTNDSPPIVESRRSNRQRHPPQRYCDDNHT